MFSICDSDDSDNASMTEIEITEVMPTDETNFEYLALDLGGIGKGVVSYISSSLHHIPPYTVSAKNTGLSLDTREHIGRGVDGDGCRMLAGMAAAAKLRRKRIHSYQNGIS